MRLLRNVSLVLALLSVCLFSPSVGVVSAECAGDVCAWTEGDKDNYCVRVHGDNQFGWLSGFYCHGIFQLGP